MPNVRALRSGWSGKLAAGQFVLAGLVLAGCLLVPRSGGFALALRLGGEGRGGEIAWLSANGARFVGGGPAGPIFAIDDPRLALAALSRGTVLVAVPAALCTAGMD